MSCAPGNSCCSSCKSSPSSLSGAKVWGTRDWRAQGEYVATGADGEQSPIAAIVGDAGERLLGIAAIAASAYHGYRRTHSAGWTIAWVAFGAFFPVIAVGVAVAQGFGKKA